jgi:uncharacterized membrane protein YebE (DUF533 family)
MQGLKTKLLIATLAALPAVALAGTHDPNVNLRQHNQQHRIAQGVRSGALTHDEATSLRSNERSIRQEERAYKSDGTLTAAERKDLHQDLNQASRNIYVEKHDGETR